MRFYLRFRVVWSEFELPDEKLGTGSVIRIRLIYVLLFIDNLPMFITQLRMCEFIDRTTLKMIFEKVWWSDKKAHNPLWEWRF